jgi:hypothetical protein
MQVDEYENMLETEEERLSVHIFGTNYERLCPELKDWVRSRVITLVWTEYVAHGPVAAA